MTARSNTLCLQDTLKLTNSVLREISGDDGVSRHVAKPSWTASLKKPKVGGDDDSDDDNNDVKPARKAGKKRVRGAKAEDADVVDVEHQEDLFGDNGIDGGDAQRPDGDEILYSFGDEQGAQLQKATNAFETAVKATFSTQQVDAGLLSDFTPTYTEAYYDLTPESDKHLAKACKAGTEALSMREQYR